MAGARRCLPSPSLFSRLDFSGQLLQILSGIIGRAAPFIFISKYWEHDNSHQASKLPAYVHKPNMGITEELDSSASQTRDAWLNQ